MKATSMLFLCMVSLSAFAQEKPAGKVHGYVFGDYFYKVDGNATEVSSSQYSKTEKDFQAFQFRRLYLYYDHNLSDKFSSQFLLEGNDGSLDSKDRYSVFLKTAYLEWKDVIPNGSIGIGLYPTPTWSWGVSEKVWNYRSVEKTITDFRKLGNASDFGVALRGKFDSKGNYGYGLMIGNGSGVAFERNKYKKFYGVLNAKPVKGLIIEGYADYEPAANDKNKTTVKGFAAYQTNAITIGVEAMQQIQAKAGTAGADKKPYGVSVFAWAPIPGLETLNAFARYDFFNPDAKIANAGFNENFIVIGLDGMPIQNVHIMPNLWINSFSDKSPADVKKDADIVARLTFFYVYK
jgi:hypothetical protein